MIREIKFRAWDTKYNQWAYFTLGHLISGDVTDIAQRCEDWCESTSLKDKNDVEIYENDIILQPSGAPENEDSYMIVKFGDMGDDRQGFWLDGCLSGSFIGVFESHEIVGNVHENPELLNG